jgi:nitrogen-specific signal transduction histidine kinase
VQKETINHLHEGVIVYGSDNRLKIVNNSVMKIWNVKDKIMAEMKGMHLSEMLDYVKEKITYGSDWGEFRENTISNFTDRIAKTGQIVRKDDTVVLFSYIPLPDGAHMLSFIDITDTCVVEKAIMEKNMALKEAHKLRYEFISGISTELKDPINSLIGFTELLLLQYYGVLNEKQQEYCKYILDSSNQLHQLINNLLEMVLVDIDSSTLELSKFEIGEAINEVISRVEKRAKEKNINITTLFESSRIEFNGDRKRIKQFLFNVLINAIQATPINGNVEVRTLSDSANIKIIIKDEGVVSKTNKKAGVRSTIFRGSAKTYIHRAMESNAASMSLVRSLIELHGGTLSISSDANGGTYVICALPINVSTVITEHADENTISKFPSKDDSKFSDLDDENSKEIKKAANG